MLGVIVNVLAVLLGGTLGLLLKKGLPQKISTATMTAIGLCVAYIGIDGMLDGENTIVLIFSAVLGLLLGTLLNLDGKLKALGDALNNRFSKNKGNISEGFVTASLLFCVGAMAIVGSLNSALSGNHSIIYTKSFIDAISALILSTTLGVGVLFSAASVFVYQGALVLLASQLKSILETAVINEITCVGSLIILALGLNLAGITKFKVANFLPSIIIAPFAYYLFNWVLSFF